MDKTPRDNGPKVESFGQLAHILPHFALYTVGIVAYANFARVTLAQAE
jgi:hypothetical protein